MRDPLQRHEIQTILTNATGILSATMNLIRGPSRYINWLSFDPVNAESRILSTEVVRKHP